MSDALYLVAGEPSGDAHGAALMRALRLTRPELKLLGRGGAKMQEVGGAGFMNWSDAAAVVGLWEVIRRYGYFRQQFAATLDEIAESAPAAVVLIDYPGFNLRLGRVLRAHKPSLKIIYYISPQVWAWNRARIPRMARWLDLMLCIFPFEADLYNQSGLRTLFVGHPMLEILATPNESEVIRDPDLIGLFPGSRLREVRKILPLMLGAAMHILKEKPTARFEVAAASTSLVPEITRLVARSQLPREKLGVVVGQAASLFRRAWVGLVASGTATLEAARFRMPFVLVYKVAWLTYFAARAVVKSKFLGMPNVLANRAIVPEFIQHHAKPRTIARHVLRFAGNPSARELVISEFDAIIPELGGGGASAAAAAAILDEIAAKRPEED
ncbi:MAG: lipid-A-disaccharide synthase [Chthoniobacterales bacterium]